MRVAARSAHITALASRLPSVLAAILSSGLLALTLAGSAFAATPARIVHLLNRERILNALPAELQLNPEWTAACEAHDTYERLNGGLSHEELPGRRGYSAAGDLIAATSVLAQGIYWGSATSRSDDPYDNAPFHLFDLLNPRIASVGAADAQGFGCVEIELGTLRAAPVAPIAYSYPGNHRSGVPTSQRAVEEPETPAEAVGLARHDTGPNILVYFDGPWRNGSRARLQKATLSSSNGARVSLRWLDNTTSNLIAPTGAILVPVRPLLPHTRYRVIVEGDVTGIAAGSSIEAALSGCGETGATVSCGQPPATACFEDFAVQTAVCGLTQSWPVKDDFTFTTARAQR